MIREPVVAGRFYNAKRSDLAREVADLSLTVKDRIGAIGVVSPHAGYVYSGRVAGELFSSIESKSTYIVLGPNHTGLGKPVGLDDDRTWKTPLGDVKVDGEMAQKILAGSRHIEKDHLCHDGEHSIEVQLPFIQHFKSDFKIVPIVIAHTERRVLKEIGAELASAINAWKDRVLIVASSDMTHYESQELAKKKDALAIEKVLSLDVDGFIETVEKNDISMCGFAPTAIMMQACIELGAKNAKLIRYRTSGDVSGDYSSVVGYAGIAIY
ncbi:MAG: AmmeMemoRadiSam system protein B [Candidatus Omnitrophota bacterium]